MTSICRQFSPKQFTISVFNQLTEPDADPKLINRCTPWSFLLANPADETFSCCYSSNNDFEFKAMVNVQRDVMSCI